MVDVLSLLEGTSHRIRRIPPCRCFQASSMGPPVRSGHEGKQGNAAPPPSCDVQLLWSQVMVQIELFSMACWCLCRDGLVTVKEPQ